MKKVIDSIEQRIEKISDKEVKWYEYILLPFVSFGLVVIVLALLGLLNNVL